MPSGIYNHINNHTNKGRTAWNKDKKMPELTGKNAYNWVGRKEVNCLICRKKIILFPDSKQKFCSSKCYGQSMVGIPVMRVYPKNWGKWNKGRKFPERSGENNVGWKGEDAKYAAIHMWIRRVKGKPVICEHCGAKKRKFHWANIDHKYSRNKDDYISLCVPCHRKYDYHNLKNNI